MIVAVLDACVLYPPALRDLFMWLAAAIVYQPRWTEDIHAEWIRNVLKNKPEVTPVQLERTRLLMDRVSDDCLVTDYAKHIPALTLPDPDDRHVLAAAIEAKASVIVTFNLTDFPASALRPYGIRAMHPDKYLTALLADAPELFLMGLKDHRASLRKPPKAVDEYLETLRINGLTRLAEHLENHRSSICIGWWESDTDPCRQRRWNAGYGDLRGENRANPLIAKIVVQDDCLKEGKAP